MKHPGLQVPIRLIAMGPSCILLFAGLNLTTTRVAFADNVIFNDDFNGSSLNPAWQILPGQGSYSLTNGQLQYFNAGSQASTTGWFSPALTLGLSFTGTSWEIDTKAQYHLNWLDTSGGSSGAQGPEVLVKFAPGTVTSGYGGPNYAGTDFAVIERDIDAYYNSNILAAYYGTAVNNDFLNPADKTIQNNVADGTYWYKIIRNGGTLTINYSTDAVNYSTALSAALFDPSSSYNDLLLGGITFSTVGSYTNYDYVTITSAAPEPSSIFLFGLGVVGLWWCRSRVPRQLRSRRAA